jgi:predicted metal-dependent hydrolase
MSRELFVAGRMSMPAAKPNTGEQHDGQNCAQHLIDDNEVMRPLFQGVLPFTTSDRTPEAVTVAGRAYKVVIARHRRARRYVLRLNDDDSLRLTVPRGASIAGGLRFAMTQGEWIGRERQQRQLSLQPWRHGTVIWFRGEQVPLTVTPGAIAWAGESIAGAPDVRRAVEAHVTALASRELPARCLELARQCHLTVARVSARNQRSRWGACSARRVITLNWRLIQMPPSVTDYVIFHELMHMNQPNHSRRFWREVDAVCSWWREAERWLRKHGRELL